MKKNFRRLVLLLLVPLLLLELGLYKRTYLLMGTFVEITLPQQNDRVVDNTVNQIKSLENKFSVFKKEVACPTTSRMSR